MQVVEKIRESGDGSRNPAHTGTDLITAARAIASIIENEAETIEAEADITANVREALADSGLFWMLLPAEFGGANADAVTAMEVMEEISRADASTGWAYFCNAVATGAAVAYGSDKLVKALFSGSERPVLCGQFGPVGTGRCVEGGFIVKGHHQFASGSSNSNWLAAGQRLLDNDGKPVLNSQGQPITFASYFPREKIRMAGNWDVTGLNGTGSYDYEVPEQFVPTEFTLDGATLSPGGGYLNKRGSALFGIGYFALGHLGHAAVALGIARRALQEMAALVAAKTRPGYDGPVSESPVFRHEFGFQEAAYWGARRNAYEVYRSLEESCQRGETLTDEQHGRVLQTTLYTHKVAHDVIDFCNSWSGSAAVRNPSVIARCLRDISVAINHMINDRILMQSGAPAIFEAWARGRLSR